MIEFWVAIAGLFTFMIWLTLLCGLRAIQDEVSGVKQAIKAHTEVLKKKTF